MTIPAQQRADAAARRDRIRAYLTGRWARAEDIRHALRIPTMTLSFDLATMRKAGEVERRPFGEFVRRDGEPVYVYRIAPRESPG